MPAVAAGLDHRRAHRLDDLRSVAKGKGDSAVLFAGLGFLFSIIVRIVMLSTPDAGIADPGRPDSQRVQAGHEAVTAEPGGLDELRGKPLHPPVHGGVVDGDPARSFAECRYRALIERERALATGTVYQVGSGAIRSNV